MNKPLINYDELEIQIQQVEAMLNEFDHQEKLLVLNFVKQRILNNIQKAKVSDTIGDHPLMKFANKFIKGHPDNEDNVV